MGGRFHSQVFSRLLISPETAAKTVVKAGVGWSLQLMQRQPPLPGLQAATADEGCVPAPPRLPGNGTALPGRV